MRTKKRLSITAILLSLLLTITILPVSAQDKTTTAADLNGGAKSGDIIIMGEYNGSPIQWRVLGTDGSSTRLISEYILFESEFGDSNNYGGSDIRRYLRDDFLDCFTEEELSHVAETTYRTLGDGSYYDLKDKFFLLSSTEVGLEYDDEGLNIGFTDGADRVAYRLDANTEKSTWWLRTARSSSSFVRIVISDGSWSGFSPSFSIGVRPACHIESNTPIYKWSDGSYHLEEPVSLENIELNHTTSTLTVGKTLELSVTFTPVDADDKGVTWSSSDESVAKVENGIVTALNAGTATITVASNADPNIKATCEITVVNKVYSVSVSPNKITLPSVKEGYDPQDPEYITIKNTGNQTIKLEDHGENPWLVITLDKNTLKPNEEAKVSIKLKDDLSAETRSTLKGFITYTSEDGTYREHARFEVTYEIRHDMKHVEAKEATHLEEGNIEYWYCEYCDKYYEGALGTNELSLEDITIPKLADHTPTDTWYHDENSHYHICECGEVLDKEAHDFKWVIDKEATTTSEGLKHEECSVCGYKKDGVAIPVLEIEIPDTGVRSNTSIFTAIALLSLSALTGTVIYQIKKKED